MLRRRAVHYYRGQLGLDNDGGGVVALLIDSVFVKVDRSPPT